MVGVSWSFVIPFHIIEKPTPPMTHLFLRGQKNEQYTYNKGKRSSQQKKRRREIGGMAMQAIFNWDHVKTPWSSLSLPSSSPLMFAENIKWKKEEKKGKEKDEGSGRSRYVCAASSSNSATPSPNYWDWWKPDKGAPAPCLSDILWPSAGAFAAMAILGKVDQLLSPKGLSMTIAPLGAVSAVLFATPNAPGARKYNIFVAQMGCAAIGVLALSAFGPGWLARSAALGASIGFMIWTRSVHPPAASLPILFIDGSKFHRLHLWYALFPGAAGCILLCLIQEMVSYLKENYKF